MNSLQSPMDLTIKVFIILIIVFFFYSCKERVCFEGLKIDLINNKIEVKRHNKILLEDVNKDLLLPENFRIKSSFIIDTLNCKLYFNSFNQYIKIYDLNEENLLDSALLNKPNMRYDFDFKLNIIDKFLIVKSNRNLIQFDLKLKSKKSILDSVFKLNPQLKFQVEGFWDYKLINDTFYLTFNTNKILTEGKIPKKIIKYPLKP
jgi:hypothetical protein